MEKTILTDVDGVLLNWNAAFHDFMLERGYNNMEGGFDNYGLGQRYGLTQEDGTELALEFNQSNHIRKLPPYADSQKYVSLLYGMGFRFVAITSLDDQKKTHENRLFNLQELFGQAIRNLYTLPIGAPKKSVLSYWKDSGLFWIEDHIENAIAGADVGLKPILVDHTYNRDKHQEGQKLFGRTCYKNPWKDIYNMVVAEYEIV